MLSTLFGLLFWDIIFLYDHDDVFILGNTRPISLNISNYSYCFRYRYSCSLINSSFISRIVIFFSSTCSYLSYINSFQAPCRFIPLTISECTSRLRRPRVLSKVNSNKDDGEIKKIDLITTGLVKAGLEERKQNGKFIRTYVSH